MIFSVSDIIISATLLINALALISGNATGGNAARDNDTRGGQSVLQGASYSDLPSLGYDENQTNEEDDDAEGGASQKLLGSDVSGEVGGGGGRGNVKRPSSTSTARERVRSLFLGIRKYSCVIVFWNLIFFVLMIVVLPG